MAVDAIQSLAGPVDKMLRRLDRQAALHRRLDTYYEGTCPFPPAVTAARITRTYRRLMPVSGAPWGALIVDSVQDRLEVVGVRSDDRAATKAAMAVWDANDMGAEWPLAQNSTLISGRSFATVWRAKSGELPRITLDSPEQMVVMYSEGSRRERVAALRRFIDEDDRTYVEVYTPTQIFKLQEAREQTAGDGRFKAGGKWWEPRASAGEDWVMANAFEEVPVSELATNRRLKPGVWPYARGEYELCLGLIDRINLLTFLGLVVAFWMGFPLRGVIGERIVERLLRDDDGNIIGRELVPPFDATAGGLAQLENPNARPFEYKAAERSNLDVFAELAQLGTLTKTPRHYMPMSGGISNINADTIRADEGGLAAKVRGIHQPFIGQGAREVFRLSALMSEDEIVLPPDASVDWADHQSRSLAERADAAVKLSSFLPWQAAAQIGLQATAAQISQWEAQAAGSAFGELLREVRTPARDAEQTSDELAAA